MHNYKDILPASMRSSLSCEHCSSKYFGCSSRVAERAGRSSRTGYILVHLSHSSIRLHVETKCDVAVAENIVTGLRLSTNNLDLSILESLYIFKTRPQLNGNTSALPLHIVNA